MLTLIRFFVFAVGLSAMSAPALAHANIVSATPADKSRGPSPATVEMNFNEAVNLAFSRMKILGPDGKQVATGETVLVPGGKGMIAPVETKLPEGVYTVDWSVLSSDGHKLTGKYSFTVVP
ncbi:MAG: copper homeostasis periplasmic binding protein CopC [Mesorhizobium sp.]|nr:copper homeostasis periplasmic binding protein CopC [Mesorhizobium sp.]MBL8577294.1 copper homeostasis periplasmic binding protein CopC [Mesorhizobium sp.]